MQIESEDSLDGSPVHPSRRSRIPGPSSPPDMGFCRIYIGTHHVGLDLVAIYARTSAGVVDGIEQREQFSRPIAVAHQCKCQRGPHAGVSVLTAILAQSRRIGFDITGVMR